LSAPLSCPEMVPVNEEQVRVGGRALWLENLVALGAGALAPLRPCAYMQNVLPRVPTVAKLGRLEVPYDVDSEFSMVDLGDVAAAAAAVLLEPGHEGRTYELCGPVPLSHRQVAAVLSAALGQPVEAVAADLFGWEARVRSAGLSPYAIDALMRMFRWYDAHDFVGSPSDLEGLLGRPAGSLDQFVHRELGGRTAREGVRDLRS